VIDPRFPNPPTIPGQIIVPDLLTPFSDAEMASALALAARHVFDDDLSRRPLCCLAAQIALETGRGRFTHRNNLGNVKASDSYQGSATFFRCNEVIGGRIVWFDPFNVACRFRAFDTLAGGAEQQIRFLGQSKRYVAAWHAAMAGDPVGFVDELHRAGYFTADPKIYRDGVVHLFQQLLGTLPSLLPDDVHIHEPVVLQPVEEHSPLTDIDLRERIGHLQIPLAVDWDEFKSARDAELRDREA
jgi:hypothetical protein